MILEFLRGQDHAVGSNRDGAPAPPPWVFLAPSLEDLRPCALGDVPAETIRRLRAWGEVDVLAPGAPPPPACRLLVAGAGAGASLSALGSAARERSIWIEGTADARALADLDVGDAPWLLPDDVPRAAAPAPGPGERAAFRFARPPGRGGGRRLLRVTERLLRRLGLSRGVGARAAYARPWASGGPPRANVAAAGTLILPAGAGTGAPEWLQRAARDAGQPVAGRAFAFLPSRGYLSQKVLFLLDSAVDDPRGEALAMKITQDPRFNARLLNESRALGLLHGLPEWPRDGAPSVLFTGAHRDLAVVGESVQRGAPFPLRSDGRANCPVAHRALDRIRTLATAGATPASGAAHAQAIREVTARLDTAYPADAGIRQAVDEALRALQACPSVPAVFVHGDPGEWNLLVDEDGSVGFLDWENAESQGPPLWDLASFLLAYARFGLEVEGVRPTPSSAARRLLEPSPLADLLVDRVLDLARRLGVPQEAVEPLFLLHAATAAVRETWRLSPGATAGGTCWRWLGEVVRRRAGSPVLARLRARPAA